MPADVSCSGPGSQQGMEPCSPCPGHVLLGDGSPALAHVTLTDRVPLGGDWGVSVSGLTCTKQGGGIFPVGRIFVVVPLTTCRAFDLPTGVCPDLGPKTCRAMLFRVGLNLRASGICRPIPAGAPT